MVKNSMIRVLIETDLLANLKKKAREENLNFSEFCRRRLIEPLSLIRLESFLKEFYKELQYSNKLFAGNKNLKRYIDV